MRYQIWNTTSGVDLGTYTADSEQGALEAMAKDAGYASYADLQKQVPAGAGEIVVNALATTECAYCGRDVAADEAVPALDDDAAWQALAAAHAADCEWIATRAHRIEV